MKRRLALFGGFFLLALTAAAQSQSGGDKNSGKVQVAATAGILKIDAKKKTVQVREVAEPGTTSTRGQGGRQSTGGGGGGGGGGRRGGGGGRRGGGGFPGGGRPGGRGATNQVKEYKIFVTKDTVLKFAGVDLEFSDLHVGDRISVSGTPKGSSGDIEATT